jgi:hypothetical protein
MAPRPRRARRSRRSGGHGAPAPGEAADPGAWWRGRRCGRAGKPAPTGPDPPLGSGSVSPARAATAILRVPVRSRVRRVGPRFVRLCAAPMNAGFGFVRISLPRRISGSSMLRRRSGSFGPRRRSGSLVLRRRSGSFGFPATPPRAPPRLPRPMGIIAHFRRRGQRAPNRSDARRGAGEFTAWAPGLAAPPRPDASLACAVRRQYSAEERRRP